MFLNIAPISSSPLPDTHPHSLTPPLPLILFLSLVSTIFFSILEWTMDESFYLKKKSADQHVFDAACRSKKEKIGYFPR